MKSGKKNMAGRSRFCLTMRERKGMDSPVVKNGTCAFTLIELLIVVAIIAILAAIAVPNFLEAQTRAKVSRVLADMRTMQTGIELYRVDNNKVPIRHDDWQNDPPSIPRAYPEGDTKVFDPAVPEARVGLKCITTPISYLSSIPKDVFNTPVRQMMSDNVPGISDVLDYWDPKQFLAMRKAGNLPGDWGGLSRTGYCLLSVGPDKYMGINAARPSYPPEPTNLRLTYHWIYDATNGTSSAGNVFRFSENLQQSDI